MTTPAIQDRLRAAGAIGAFVADLVDFFAVYHRETYGWDGAPIHDAVAVAHVIQEGLVTTIERNVEIELESDLCRGRTVVDRWRRTDRPVERARRRRPRRGRVLRPARRADRQARVDGRRRRLRRGAVGLAQQVRARPGARWDRPRPPAVHVDELPGRLRLHRGDDGGGRRPARRARARRRADVPRLPHPRPRRRRLPHDRRERAGREGDLRAAQGSRLDAGQPTSTTSRPSSATRSSTSSRSTRISRRGRRRPGASATGPTRSR